jgi:hypothetical protein
MGAREKYYIALLVVAAQHIAARVVQMQGCSDTDITGFLHLGARSSKRLGIQGFFGDPRRFKSSHSTKISIISREVIKSSEPRINEVKSDPLNSRPLPSVPLLVLTHILAA